MPYWILVAGLLGAIAATTLLGAILFFVGTRATYRPGSGWHRGIIIRQASLVIGVVVAIAVAVTLPLGQGLPLLGPIIALCWLVGIAISNTIIRPRLQSDSRVANLQPRLLRDYVPPVVGSAALVASLVQLGTIAFTTISAGADDLGRPGRMLTRSIENGEFAASSSRGPYPGWYYTGWLLVVLVLILVVAGWAMLAVIRRGDGFGVDNATDELLRGKSMTTIVATIGFAMMSSHLTIAPIAANQHLAAQYAYSSDPFVGIALLVSSFLALASLIWFVALMPTGATFANRQPRDQLVP